jgi:hypothetical protein
MMQYYHYVEALAPNGLQAGCVVMWFHSGAKVKIGEGSSELDRTAGVRKERLV